ncbi:aspartyl/asparaginyl beta-hydroxylase domain-containing protein [Pseudoalteromonas denitrificans]|jgi:hypothetical protein|uniref:Aspartyl/Asparaginyl beta-hydroxylase n=1 Tax=Pseudoalteromonas denitrificans DSM 6059 TaxID=1123010 RepID=A0A1I1SAH6_9GAMM|nr:aspartyl/asparaginyl beta-hydroxylase domain-containing protein [Pseudoalteromonas denitrificans]SFD43397.1 Aspartyl/Asparaginyl beta-hydroxylase [Pseudoalteromonas denitrificans DSM 6059]
MKLVHEFYKLPFVFDISRLQQEVNQFNESDWQPHHENFKGNFAIPLISVGGSNNNQFKGAMASTKALETSPYLQQVIASFGDVFGRSRLMRLDPNCEVPLHFDINYHWYNRVRIHIPIFTNTDVTFYCGDKKTHMAEGECWIFDSWKNHKVVNASEKTRIHLVIDTTGSRDFWNTVDKSTVPWLESPVNNEQLIPFSPTHNTNIKIEKYNAPIVMPPGEVNHMISEFINELTSAQENQLTEIDKIKNQLRGFSQDWTQLWALYGSSESGWQHYHNLRDTTFHNAKHLANSLKLSNGENALLMLIHCIIDPALSPDVKT